MAITLRDKATLCSSSIKRNGRIIVPSEFEVESFKNSIIEEEEDKRLKYVKPSEFVGFAMRTLDKSTQLYQPFSFAGRESWIPIYNSAAKRILLKTARQLGKTTMLGNRALTYCCMQIGFHVLIVTPSMTQTKELINTRIKEPIETSEVLKKWTNSRLLDNAFLKKFSTGSKITLRYAFLNADRCRGIAGVDCLIIDEIQDIIKDNIPVIEQTAFAGSKEFKIFIYAGTPKSLENPIEDYWTNKSSQNEWAIPCWRHAFSDRSGSSSVYWNVIINENNIQKRGLSCEKCHNLINYNDPAAHWVSMNPKVWDKNSGVELPYEGFHIPQLISPDCEWSKVMQQKQDYSKSKFYNEVLGVSYDSGEKPITRQDLIDNCSKEGDELDIQLGEGHYRGLRDELFDGRPIFAGIDWSGGSDKSKTVLNLATYMVDRGRQVFVPFYWKVFDGPESEPEVQLKIIIELLHKWRVRYIGVDYGGGFYPNDRLSREFGAQRVAKYQYSNPKQKIKWEPNLGRFIIHRSECLTALFAAIKRKDVFRFPRWDQWEKPYGQDMLAISAEYDDRSRSIIYQKSNSLTDDSAHSLLYSFLASFFEYRRPEVLNGDSLSNSYEEY